MGVSVTTVRRNGKNLEAAPLKELLLPRTDAGVAAQLAVFVSGVGIAMISLRRHRDWLLLVTGMSVLGLSIFGVRALH